MSDGLIFTHESEILPTTSLTNDEKLQLVAKVSADATYDWDIAAWTMD